MIRHIRPGAPLRGSVRTPGDKSISHRYALLAAMAEGRSELGGFSPSDDCGRTLDCLRALGARVRRSRGVVEIEGCGLRGFLRPEGILDAGNSGTTMRLLAGMLAGQDFDASITGDESLVRRPMRRILEPLELMGASVRARDGNYAPLEISGRRLSAIRYEMPVASAQVKSCVLLAGLYADGVTAVREPLPTRDHTEVALRHFGADLRENGPLLEVAGNPKMEGAKLAIPGDLSGAAFFLAAAAVVPGSEIRLPEIGLNRRRTALLDYLVSAGLDLRVENESVQASEPRGDVTVRHGGRILEGALPRIEGATAAALIDELPVLAVLGAHAAGGLEIRDAGELRVKESDRIAGVVAGLRAMGVQVEELPDGMNIPGGQALRGEDIHPAGDHRIAMAFAVAGLAARGETRIHQAECAGVSFPGFWDALDSLRCMKPDRGRCE